MPRLSFALGFSQNDFSAVCTRFVVTLRQVKKNHDKQFAQYPHDQSMNNDE